MYKTYFFVWTDYETQNEEFDLTAETYSNILDTCFRYSEADRVTTAVLRDAVRLTNTYTNGRLTRTVRRGYYQGSVDQIYDTEYDDWGSVTKITVGGLELSSYTYAGKNGNLTRRIYGPTTVSYAYDYLDRVKTVSYNYHVRFTYDGYNMFAYCENNPVNSKDGSGMWPVNNTMTQMADSRKLSEDAKRKAIARKIVDNTKITHIKKRTIKETNTYNRGLNGRTTYDVSVDLTNEETRSAFKDPYVVLYYSCFLENTLIDLAKKNGDEQSVLMDSTHIFKELGAHIEGLYLAELLNWDALYNSTHIADLNFDEDRFVVNYILSW